MSEPQLIEAAKAGDVNRMQALIEGGENLEQKDDYGWTALNWAAGRGDSAIVLTLLEAGADAFNRGRDLRTPYQIALAAAQVDVAVPAATGRAKQRHCAGEACSSLLQGLSGQNVRSQPGRMAGWANIGGRCRGLFASRF